MKQLTAILFFAASTAVFFSCKHDPIITPVLPVAPTVCFESDVLPLFISNCAKSGCHDAESAADGYVFDTFPNIIARGIVSGDSSASQIYKALTGNGAQKMPQAPEAALTDAQIHTIALWISEGATNTVNCEGTCDDTHFTYSKDVLPILQTNCLGCHNGAAQYGGLIPLDSYDGVAAMTTQGFLMPAITHEGTFPMPKNGKKLSNCKISIIQKWVDAGAPNN